jgi:hypothetical protein
MKFLSLLTLLATAVAVSAIPQQGGRRFRGGQGRNRNGAGNANAGAGAAVGAGAGTGAGNAVTGSVTRGGQTLMFTEIGGVPGNECLTFRNNGTFVPYIATPFTII